MLVVMIRVRIPSPIGDLWAFVHQGALVALDFEESRVRQTLAALTRRLGLTAFRDADDALDLRERFHAYFDERDPWALAEIPVDAGGTPFQQAVWTTLRSIPPGTTRSYGDVARHIGSPGAVRAVGAANGANPVPIVIPCHRVVRTGGALGGYGGGIERKTWLLSHERASLPLEGLEGPLFSAAVRTGQPDRP
jgi:methylated-DNA-[protein]-cysteine S-methyltransferase